jgi:hypothetical protein
MTNSILRILTLLHVQPNNKAIHFFFKWREPLNQGNHHFHILQEFPKLYAYSPRSNDSHDYFISVVPMWSLG